MIHSRPGRSQFREDLHTYRQAGNSPERSTFPQDHPFAPYIDWEHNDAHVLETTLDPDFFELTIAHYNVCRLASILDSKGGWPVCGRRFPVRLRFSKIEEFNVFLQSPAGLRKIRASLQNVIQRMSEVVCLRVRMLEDGTMFFRLQLIIDHRYRIPEKDCWLIPSAHVVFLCHSFEVQEDIASEFAARFGEESLPLLRSLQAEGYVQHWCMPDFERLVEKFKQT